MNHTTFRFAPVLAGVLIVQAWGADPSPPPTSTPRAGRWILRYHSEDPERYSGLAFADPTHGWIVGDAGRILHSRDGGTTWEPQSSPTTEGFRCVHFVSASSGWAAGANNTVVGTRDGGRSWSVVHPPGDPGRRAFMAMQFVNGQEGWICHNFGGLVHTCDGGRTWRAHDGLAREALVSLCFLDVQRGWVLGVRGTLLHTEDGGQTWARQDLTTQLHGVASFSTLCLRDRSHGWIGTDAGISSYSEATPPLFRTTDGGRTWSVEGCWPGKSVLAVWFQDSESGWCAEMGGLYATADGGRSWVREADGGGDPFVHLTFTDDSHGWALTFGGDVYQYSR